MASNLGFEPEIALQYDPGQGLPPYRPGYTPGAAETGYQEGPTPETGPKKQGLWWLLVAAGAAYLTSR